MKKAILVLFIGVCIFSHAAAQEMQFSLGSDFTLGAYKVNNTIFLPITPGVYYDMSYDVESLLIAPGISFFVRYFIDTESPVTRGFVCRTRASLVTSWHETGYVDGSRVSGKYGLRDEFIMISDYGMGISYRYRLGSNFSMYADLGANITIMDSEDYDDSWLTYTGAGIFANMGFQFDLGSRMYLEFGVNSILNAFSRQEGQIRVSPTRVIKYEDTGKWDLALVAFYLHVGWRFDIGALRQQQLEQLLRSQPQQRQPETQPPQQQPSEEE